MNTEQKNVFFDEIVRKLHENGTLKNFATLKGEPVDGLRKIRELMAVHMGIDEAAIDKMPTIEPIQPSTRRGTVKYIGDVPYDGLTSEHLHGTEIKPTQRHRDLTQREI